MLRGCEELIDVISYINFFEFQILIPAVIGLQLAVIEKMARKRACLLQSNKWNTSAQAYLRKSKTSKMPYHLQMAGKVVKNELAQNRTLESKTVL